MKNITVVLIAVLLLQQLVDAQVNQSEGGLGSQSYSKTISEYKVIDFINNEVLDLPDGLLTGVYINSITASSSGEITTVIFDCKDLNKKGLVFSFWDEYFNEYNTHYKGYAFKYLEYADADKLLNLLEEVIEEKKDIVGKQLGDLSMYAYFKWKDLSFVFYKIGVGSNKIRVFWQGFDAEWNQANLKTTIRRFRKYFDEE